jgi:hypothetical protein
VILPSDEDYQETKRIKRDGTPLPAPFRELAAWVASRYAVDVLNVRYEYLERDRRPRLSVIVDSSEDGLAFREGRFGPYRRDRQREVRDQFVTMLGEQGSARYPTDGLFVIFPDFERLARIEANESVGERELEQLAVELADPELWTISRLFDGVTFFFYTDAQARSREARGAKEDFASRYARLVEPHDEFGYLRRRPVTVRFDSKQNFDENYESNWVYYYK